jgi:serine/threonine protein kinase
MHAEGLVHRDIKPANIMRCVDGAGGKADDAAYTYKLIDFGTALGVDERVARAAMLTIGNNRGVGAGTPPYMSPEMFKVLCRLLLHCWERDSLLWLCYPKSKLFDASQRT